MILARRDFTANGAGREMWEELCRKAGISETDIDKDAEGMLEYEIQLNVENIHRAVVKIGGRGSEMFSRNSTIVDLKGVMSVNGIVEIGHGCLLRVDEGGVLTFGNNVRIGAMSKVFCTNEIKFGNELDLSWECQVFDTNFHLVRELS